MENNLVTDINNNESESIEDDCFESFGQSERLVDRLKDLTGGYGDGLDVFKESFQNGDDAGATEMKICLDLRKNKDFSQTLFSSKLNEVQGESFWIYNNALFKESDFKSLANLGGRNKTKKAGVIGKFGLGFNSVYNITDMPSIVSGENLVILDPNFKYLPQNFTKKNEPGMRIDLKRKEFLKRYEDQMKPYNHIFGCDIFSDKNSYNGTLIRLPFRKSESEISDTIYTEDRAKQILQILIKHAESLLQFTQNVCKLELYILKDGEEPEDMKNVFKIEKSLVEIIEKHNVEIEVTPLCSPQQKPLIEQSNILNVIGSLIKSNESNVEKTTTFIQKIAFSSNQTDVLSDIETKFSNSYWFQTANCFKYPEELRNANQNTLPCTAVSFNILPIDTDESKLKFQLNLNPFNGILFCFLPLPKSANAKFHINGNFLLTSTREDIIDETNERIDTFKADWNKYLQSCLAKTLIKCCQDMISHLDYEMAELMYLWPLDTKFKLFEEEFFGQILCYNLKIPIFKRDTQSYSIDKCKILKLTFNPEMAVEATNVLQNIFGDQYFVLQLPTNISNYINEKRIHIQNVINDLDFCNLFIQNITKFPKTQIIKVINYLMSEYSFNFKLSKLTAIGCILRDNKCIPSNINATLKMSSELLDPSSKITELYDTDKDDVFPDQDIFQNNHKMLLEMGLIWKYLPSDMLLERLFALKNDNVKYDSWQIVNHFITTLVNENSLSRCYNNHKIIKETKLLSAKKSEFKSLIWFSDSRPDNLYSLDDLYDEKCEKLIFRIRPIFDLKKIDKHCKQYVYLLKLKKNDEKEAIEQFKVIHNDWREMVNEKRNLVAQSIYEYFLNFLDWLSLNANKNWLELGLPEDMLFLSYNGIHDFYNIKCFAFRVRYPSNPYMMKLPYELSKYRKVMINLGVKERFETNYLLSVLSEIYETSQNKIINESITELCINIVKELDTVIEIKTVRESIYLPDKKMVLRRVEDLCFDDNSKSWLIFGEVNVVNDGVPIGIAKKLGIIRLQTHYVKQFMKCFSFGQQEPLKARITKLLDSYPNFSDIPKEFLQNADDSGASEIEFILDTRTHQSTKVFSPEFSMLQGPALCVYNNKTFTESDFEGIKTLGVGNKADEKFKVGKYGVGFNTVYHLTDAPQILSNLDNYVLFDPLCKYLPLDSNNPGWRISVDKTKNKENPLDVYEDVIKSFYGSFDDKSKLANGTMFRFPLRREVSDLYNKVFTIDELEKIITKQADELKNSMIFLKNIKKIKVTKVKHNGHETIFEFEKKFMSDSDKIEHDRFINYFKSSIPKDIPGIGACIFQYSIQINDLKSLKNTDFRIISQIGFKRQLNIEHTSKYFPLGSIAIPINIENLETFNGHLYCFMPLPIPSMVRYHINGYFELANESRQALFKLTDMRNEKLLWNQHIFNDIIANLILEGIKYLKNSHENFYASTPDKIEEHYLKYFPTIELDNQYIDSAIYLKDMIKTFYENIFNSNEKLIPIYKLAAQPSIEWISIRAQNLLSSASFKNWFFTTSNYKAYYEPLCNILINYGLKLCTFNQLTNFVNSTYKKLISNQTIINDVNSLDILKLFKKNNIIKNKNIENTLFKNHCLPILLEFCISDLNKRSLYLAKELENVSLLLDASNTIRSFSRSSPIFKEIEYEIFEGCPEKFIHKHLWQFSLQHFTKGISIEELNHLLPYAIDKKIYYIQQKKLFNFSICPEIDEKTFKKLNIIWKIIDRLIMSRTPISYNIRYYYNQDDRRELTSFLSPLSEWALIPVKFADSQNLYAAPINIADLILKDINSKIPDEIRMFFNKCNLPNLAQTSENLRKIAINVDKISDIMKFLMRVWKEKKELIDTLDENMRNKLLVYLLDHNLTAEDKNSITSLPLFKNVFDEFMSVKDKKSIIIKNTIPLCGLKNLFPSSSYYLARYDSNLISAYHKIYFKVMDIQEFYESYLMKLENLEFDEKYTHISAIKESSCLSSKLIEILINFRFIKGTSMLTAANFYDPRVKVFKILFRRKQDAFPTQPYLTDSWISFLHGIGLKGDEILKMPKTINEYLKLTKTAYNSDIIDLDELIYIFNELYSNINKFESKENISVVLQEFQESLEFVTRVFKINSNKLNETRDIECFFGKVYNMLRRFYENFDFELVKMFFKNIKSFEIVLHETEKDLKKGFRLDSIDKFVERGLRKYEQIENYLYIYPDKLFEYKFMFSNLGLISEVNVEFCMSILKKIYLEMKNYQNDTVDTHTADFQLSAIRAMNLLFKNFTDYPKDEDLELYLLNGSMELRKSTDLYYIDTDGLFHLYTTNFAKEHCLVPLKVLGNYFSEYNFYCDRWNSLINKLKPIHQPKPVSKFITKKMINDSFNKTIDYDLEIKIKNNAFIKVMMRLLDLDSEVTSEFFMNMKFYKLDKIITKKYFNEAPIENSELKERHFMELDNAVKSIIFYRNTTLPYITVYNLYKSIKDGLTEYYSYQTNINAETEKSIIDLLLSEEDKYETVILEHDEFVVNQQINNKASE